MCIKRHFRIFFPSFFSLYSTTHSHRRRRCRSGRRQLAKGGEKVSRNKKKFSSLSSSREYKQKSSSGEWVRASEAKNCKRKGLKEEIEPEELNESKRLPRLSQLWGKKTFEFFNYTNTSSGFSQMSLLRKGWLGVHGGGMRRERSSPREKFKHFLLFADFLQLFYYFVCEQQ